MASNTEVNEEIEALKAIMMEDVQVLYSESGQPNTVEITVKPATADNIEEQHVIVTLVVNLPQGYPDISPDICLRNPRGIDDDVLELIRNESISKCEEYIGLPVIYELTELVREKLTANNTPSCPCAICLFQFTDNDHFTKTKCFHYFHSNCLGRYILNCEETAAAEEKENQQPVWMTKEKRQLVCPVCREPLNEDANSSYLLSNPPPEEGELMADFNPTSPEVKALQEKMMSLYLHQKSKGGIINLEEEKNKFLISAANNMDNLDGEIAVENEETNNHLLQSKDVTKMKSKPEVHGPPHNVKRGGRGRGGYNQGKRDYSSSGSWWGGNRGRNSRKGNKHGGGKQNVVTECGKQNLGFEEKIQSKHSASRQTDRQGQNRHVNVRNNESNYAEQNFAVDEPMKNTRKYFNRTYHHRGRGSGNSSRGMPPPGFSELDKNVKPHPTS